MGRHPGRQLVQLAAIGMDEPDLAQVEVELRRRAIGRLPERRDRRLRTPDADIPRARPISVASKPPANRSARSARSSGSRRARAAERSMSPDRDCGSEASVATPATGISITGRARRRRRSCRASLAAMAMSQGRRRAGSRTVPSLRHAMAQAAWDASWARSASRQMSWAMRIRSRWCAATMRDSASASPLAASPRIDAGIAVRTVRSLTMPH